MMTQSEAQLATEFLLALNQEAKSHREYLQLLYLVTLGALGTGLAVSAAALLAITRSALNDFKSEIGSKFDAEAARLLDEKNKEVELEIKNLNKKIKSLESEADRKIDDLVRFMKIKADRQEASENGEEEYKYLSVSIYGNESEPSSELSFIALNLGCGVSYREPNFKFLDSSELKINFDNGEVAIVNGDDLSVNQIKPLLNKLKQLAPEDSLILYFESEYPPIDYSIPVTQGPAELIEKLMSHQRNLRK